MKVGLLIGIDYRGKENELRGCIDDIKHMKVFLENRGYDRFIILTEDGELPTGENIMRGFNSIIEWINNEDVQEVWIHYSGHGSHIKDMDGDEDDGFDEVLIPLDYDKNGIISDDLINKYFISRIRDGVKIYIFMDCCHSGTIMDLEYKNINGEWIKNNDKSVCGKILCISGCRDYQLSSECFNLNNNGRWSGALTTTFMNFQKNISIREMLNEFKNKLEPFNQIPLLTASWKFDIDKPFFD